MRLGFHELSDLLAYEPETGVVTWKKTRRGNPAGRPAGTIDSDGYLRLRTRGHAYAIHRIAWMLTHGMEIPAGMQIDHINGDRRDNRAVNLRLATPDENRLNSGPRPANRSGFKGVSHHKTSGLWRAQITVNKTRHSLGYFKTPEEAHSAYCVAAAMLHGAFARTR